MTASASDSVESNATMMAMVWWERCFIGQFLGFYGRTAWTV